MATWMASLGERRQYLLNLFSRNVISPNDSAPVDSAGTSHAEIPINTSGELSLKLTLLCLLTTFSTSLTDPVLIERLLHPARFYNLDPFDAASNLAMMLTTSLGCPTIHVLTQCFQIFRIRGLFDPKNKPTRDHAIQSSCTFGSMLGTAFYPVHYARYRTCSHDGIFSVGNGFWARVLELIPRSKAHSKFGYGLLESNRLRLYAISNYDKKNPDPMAHVVCEKDRDQKKYFEDITVSEAPAIAVIFYYLAFGKVQPGFLTFTLALLYPTVVKLFFAFLALDRKTFHVLNTESVNNTDVFQIQFGGSRLSCIEGERGLVNRFFEYYGEPIRNIFTERILMIALAFFLGPIPFVVAFFALTTEHYAYPWLAHQTYVLFTWYIACLLKLNSCGRTEDRIAKALYNGKKLVFVNADGTSAVKVTLQTTFVKPNRPTAPKFISAEPLNPVLEMSTEDTSQATGIATPPPEISAVEVVDAPSKPSSATSPTTSLPTVNIETTGRRQVVLAVIEEADNETPEEELRTLAPDKGDAVIRVNRKHARGGRRFQRFK
jgi:hypothetical protein